MSDGVFITLSVRLKPEVADQFIAGLPEGMKETIAFGGLREIRVVRNKSEPERILIVEHWDSEEAHAAYMKYRTESGALDALQGILAEPPVTEAWTLVTKD